MTAKENEKLIIETAELISKLAHKPPCGFVDLLPRTYDCEWCRKNCGTDNINCWIYAISNNWLNDFHIEN